MIKATAAGIALVLLCQSVPPVLGQQSASRDLLPDSPGTVQSASLRGPAMIQQAPVNDPNAAQNSGTQNAPQASSDTAPPAQTPDNASNKQVAPLPSNPQDSGQSPPPQQPKEPVGTAASESVAVTGVAASRPAGVAVAPAKQRRVRMLLIKVGAVVGVGVAVGATLALSEGSPSRPPGTH